MPWNQRHPRDPAPTPPQGSPSPAPNRTPTFFWSHHELGAITNWDIVWIGRHWEALRLTCDLSTKRRRFRSGGPGARLHSVAVLALWCCFLSWAAQVAQLDEIDAIAIHFCYPAHPMTSLSLFRGRKNATEHNKPFAR